MADRTPSNGADPWGPVADTVRMYRDRGLVPEEAATVVDELLRYDQWTAALLRIVDER